MFIKQVIRCTLEERSFCCNIEIYWFRLSWSALIFKCLPFGLKGRGLLFVLVPDVSPASVVGIFRELAPVLLLFRVYWKLPQTRAKRQGEEEIVDHDL